MKNRGRYKHGAIAAMLLASLFVSNPVEAKIQLFKKKQQKTDTSSKATNKYESITQNATRYSGVIDIYKKGTDYYFAFPTTLLNRDFLVVNKISQVPAQLNDAGINKGMNFENVLIRFNLNKEQKKLYALNYKPLVEVKAGDAIGQSVDKNYGMSILEYFDIEGYSKDSSVVLFKVNKVYDGDKKSFNNVFGNIGIGTSPQNDYSFIVSAKSFPENIVVKALLTTSIPGAETAAKLTVEVTSNLVLLPEQPMVPRFADPRVGYFSINRWFFNDDQHQLDKRKLITRWRLEPKDKEAYAKGKLVEPVKPIVFYIDPSTPKKWRSFIIQGVYDWQAAFEAAGFKNAIIAKEVPDSLKDFDIDDVRYSSIVYAASDKANAMGPSVYDPRSGEIIESDVVWWHNVMTAVQAWMRVQTGAIDPKSRANRFDDEHMGEAIRFISSHEIGHTLGLAHNMGSSSFYPVDSLRSKTFTQKFATAPSIMDYARFNYVAQPEDSVKHITPNIGMYDKFAISWGYRYYGDSSAFEEDKIGNKMLTEAAKNPFLTFLPTQDMRNAIDPRAQIEDLGDNSMKASEYGLMNLKRIMPHVLNWTTKPGDSYEEAGMLLNSIIGQWFMYSYHVLTNVGGIYINSTVMGDGKNTYTFVEADKQKSAVSYLIKNAFTYQDWLFKSDVYKLVYPIKIAPDNLSEYAPFASFQNSQSYLFWDLLNNDRITRMIANEAENGSNAYTATQLLDDLNKGIFEKTYAGKSLSIYERSTQKAYVDALIIASDRGTVSKEKKKLAEDAFISTVIKSRSVCSHDCCSNSSKLESVKIFNGPERDMDAISLKRGELLRIEELLKRPSKGLNTATKYHYQDLLLRIDQALRK